MRRSHFQFSEAFFNGVMLIRDKRERCDVYDALCRYALYGDEPTEGSLSDMAAAVFDLVKPSLKAARAKAFEKRKGAAKGQEEGQPKVQEEGEKKSRKKGAPSSTTLDIPFDMPKGAPQEKEGKERENSPFLPPSSFPPEPPILSTPYNPPKEKEKGEKETPPALFPSVTERPPPQGGGAHVMRRSFKPPTLEEVQAYCAERGSKVDAWKFYDYFSTPDDMGRTWIDSEGKPVRNWKQKIITWEKKQRTPKSQTATGNIFLEMLAEERAKEAEK